jgi:Type IV Pilus-assembly protein W
MTAPSDTILLCDGTSNTTAATHTYINEFSVNNKGQLMCTVSVDGVAKAAVPLLNENTLQNIQVLYGVKTTGTNDFNVDTYKRADQMANDGTASSDWLNVSSVKLILTFTNPLAAAGGQATAGQAATIRFERVIGVMSRAGVKS